VRLFEVAEYPRPMAAQEQKSRAHRQSLLSPHPVSRATNVRLEAIRDGLPRRLPRAFVHEQQGRSTQQLERKRDRGIARRGKGLVPLDGQVARPDALLDGRRQLVALGAFGKACMRPLRFHGHPLFCEAAGATLHGTAAHVGKRSSAEVCPTLW